MSKFIDLVETASYDLRNHKRPDVTKAVAAIDAVLVAMGSHGTGNETVDSLDVYDDGTISISTSYRSKGWDDHDSYTIPGYIAMSDDPVKAAKIYKAKSDVWVAERHVRYCAEQSILVTTKLVTATEALNALTTEL